ncbi:unnamed protein product [Coregonus sp. 'balchen']|nr:unnamed protein product [Coregonus sp. 'balchen']
MTVFSRDPQPRSRLKTMGHRAFSRTAPWLWKALPDTTRAAESLSSLKAQLKTVLFRKAFKDLC